MKRISMFVRILVRVILQMILFSLVDTQPISGQDYYISDLVVNDRAGK